MKLNLILFAGAIAEQTTTWETTTTEFTTRVDDWCGRHHDTLESFTQQVFIGGTLNRTGTAVPIQFNSIFYGWIFES